MKPDSIMRHCSRRCGLLRSLEETEDGIIAHIDPYPPTLLPPEAEDLLRPHVGKKILLGMIDGKLAVAIDEGSF